MRIERCLIECRKIEREPIFFPIIDESLKLKGIVGAPNEKTATRRLNNRELRFPTAGILPICIGDWRGRVNDASAIHRDDER